MGEFRSGRLATRQVDVVADKFKTIFDDREGQVDHTGRRYRSIFTGFSQDDAKAACAQVSAQNLPCQASGPG